MLNAIRIQPTPEMERVIKQIDAAVQRVWRGDPAAGLNADEVRERVADLEMLLPQVALHADEFQETELSTAEDFRALYAGFALHALVVMIDARNLWGATKVSAFFSDLEQISADIYELRKWVDGLDEGQAKYVSKRDS